MTRLWAGSRASSPGGADEISVINEERQTVVSSPETDGGACVRNYQTSHGVPTVSASGKRESVNGMDLGVSGV